MILGTVHSGAFLAGPQEWMKFDEYLDFTQEEGETMRVLTVLTLADFWINGLEEMYE